jgi:uncharacterized iron-regulated protein
MMRALALCLALLGSAAANAGEPDWQASWRSWAEAAHKEHVLAGRVYDVAAAKLSAPQDGPVLLLLEGIVLLGEVHDNAAHHRLRSWLIAEALRARPDRRPAVVFEQIRSDQRPALDQFKALDEQCCRLATAIDLLRLLKWDTSGWPPAEAYRPLFDAVIAGRLPIYPGDAPRDLVRAMARGGAEALGPEERIKLRLDVPLPQPLAEALEAELADSHCGGLPAQAVAGMTLAQRFRDAHLADALIGAAARHGSAILIAGNGHARSDRGVPWYIRLRTPGTRVMSVLFLEVEKGKTDPLAYIPRDPDGQAAADTIIFTPRADRDDPCLRFQKKG